MSIINTPGLWTIIYDYSGLCEFDYCKDSLEAIKWLLSHKIYKNMNETEIVTIYAFRFSDNPHFIHNGYDLSNLLTSSCYYGKKNVVAFLLANYPNFCDNDIEIAIITALDQLHYELATYILRQRPVKICNMLISMVYNKSIDNSIYSDLNVVDILITTGLDMGETWQSTIFDDANGEFCDPDIVIYFMGVLRALLPMLSIKAIRLISGY